MAATEKREINLVIDRQDMMVKHFVAGIWKEKDYFNGLSFKTALTVDSALAFGPRREEFFTAVGNDKHTITIRFPKPVKTNETYSYELQLLLNPQEFVHHLGNLNIVEWPKEELGEIYLLKSAGDLFFSSVLAQIEKDPISGTQRIKPGPLSKRLVSHANRSSVIRIEWGYTPTYRLHFNYSIQNKGQKVADRIELSGYIPPRTQFQNVISNFGVNMRMKADEDQNSLISMNIGSLGPYQKTTVGYSVDVQPLGNLGVGLLNFGNSAQYQAVTKPNMIGARMLNSSKYWSIEDEEVQKLVNALKKNSKNLSEYIKLAFEFTNQKIKYEMNESRDDAATTVRSRIGDCSEMSDLFVTLLRAAGIPAKIVHGWTIDLQTHALGPHAWCEFFSPNNKAWFQCDPTWGFLSGVSCQHICRQREGLNPDQHTYSWVFTGDTTLNIRETVSLEIL